jgi:hypothetical protein
MAAETTEHIILMNSYAETFDLLIAFQTPAEEKIIALKTMYELYQVEFCSFSEKIQENLKNESARDIYLAVKPYLDIVKSMQMRILALEMGTRAGMTAIIPAGDTPADSKTVFPKEKRGILLSNSFILGRPPY